MFRVRTVSKPLTKDILSRRRSLVQSLRGAGVLCNVHGIPDDARRSRVEAFVNTILASTGPRKAKALARASLSAYVLTFTGDAKSTSDKKEKKQRAKSWKAGASPAAADGTAFRRVRGKSHLFTYNWDFLGSPFPDGSDRKSVV